MGTIVGLDVRMNWSDV